MKWENKLAVKQYHIKKDIDRYSQELANIRKKELETGVSDSFNEQATIFGLRSLRAEYQSLEKPIYIGDTTFIKTNKDIIVNELAELLSEINNKNYVYRETVNETTKEKEFKLVDVDNKDVLLLPDLESIEFSFKTCSCNRRNDLESSIADYDKIAYSKYSIVGAYCDGSAHLNYSIIMAFIIALNIERFLLERDLNEEEISKIKSKFIDFYKEDKYFCDCRFYDSFFNLEDVKVLEKNIENNRKI